MGSNFRPDNQIRRRRLQLAVGRAEASVIWEDPASTATISLDIDGESQTVRLRYESPAFKEIEEKRADREGNRKLGPPRDPIRPVQRG